MTPALRANAVAIIGFALRLPGANTAEQFWAGIAEKRELFKRFAPDELTSRPDPTHESFVPVRGVVDGVADFDAAYFGMSPREAQLTDPQQRLFLECAVEALEHAAYFQHEGSGRIGVYAGVGNNMYLLQNILGHTSLVRNLSEMQLLLASEKDHVATRTAHRLGLHGPAITMQTSCSTSLVATHMAVQSLINGEADIMLAGGASIHLPQESGYIYSPHDIMSPDGHCRAFAADAQGTVPSNGVAVVVLKRAAEAVRDGDHIYATIIGSAVNNDGARKVGYTAPSVAGQTDVILAAQRAAGITAASIQHVETHGTATEIGDAIEVAALTEAFRQTTGSTAFCSLGTLKPNIGHVDTAAGVAGLIKTALALRYKQLPPNVNCSIPNPELRLETTPFYINDQLKAWPSPSDGPRRAAVSAFGIGGTNAHLILEEAPSHAARMGAAERLLIPLSAASENAAHARITDLANHVAREPDLDVRNIAVTTQHGRSPMRWRSAAVVTATEEIAEDRFSPIIEAADNRQVAFLFTGTVPVRPGAASELYDRFDAFREAVDECAAGFRKWLGTDVRWSLCEPAPSEAERASLDQLLNSQAALFTLEVASAKLLISCGIKPHFVVGHSVGEYAAACVSGAMSTADAASLVVTRARLLSSVPGAMLAVFADETSTMALADSSISLAAVNSQRSVVVSGPHESIAAMAERLAQHGLESRLLPISTASHSSMLNGIVGDFAAVAKELTFSRGRIPAISTVTGRVVEGDWMTPDYWTGHLLKTVRFADAMECLLAQAESPLLIEVGPGHTLVSLAQQVAGSRQVLTATMLPGREPRSASETVLEAMGTAWSAGIPLDWAALGTADGYRVPLPTYPFERSRHWLDPVELASSLDSATGVIPADTPAPVAKRAHLGANDELRSEVAAIWLDLLGVAPTADNDSFFAHGGQSLQLVRLIARIREMFGVNIPLRAVASSPTLAGIVKLIQQAGKPANEAN